TEGSMRTQMMIILVVTLVALAGLGVLIGLIAWLGWVGGGMTGLGLLAVLVASYLLIVKPWHIRWGATDQEVTRVMPGDELVTEASSATHAISIQAAPEAVWPWLIQLGYGRAGWYSYDWIDNDFRRSSDRVLPEFQQLSVGDEILMAPNMGLTVHSIEVHKSIVSMMNDGTTSWCLALDSLNDGGTRLVSRWRPKLDMPAPMMAIVEPGAFIMERKMLKNLRRRIEGARRFSPI
ncbi:MAG: hypothetical protein ACR2OI_09170, partial [Acidimicrobiia bacterium]